MAWWDGCKCQAKIKNGKQCQNVARRVVCLSEGQYKWFFTCYRHKDQEEEIEKRLTVELEIK